MNINHIWQFSSSVEISGDSGKTQTEINLRKFAYEDAKRNGWAALKWGRTNAALYWFYTAMRILGYLYFGPWADAELENALRQISAKFQGKHGANGGRTQGKRRIVHLATYLMDYGGHTEMILNWARSFARNDEICQSFLSSECPQAKLTTLQLGPNKLKELHNIIGESILCPQGLTPWNRVQWLFDKLCQLSPDVIILHIHPDDIFSVVAVMAFQKRYKVRILYFNMADHLPNMGMAWADYVVEFRAEGARYTRWLRNVPQAKILRMPLWSRERQSPRLVRGDLRIPDNATVSATITTYSKIRSDGYWDIGKVLFDLLISEPNHYHLMVGDGNDNDRQGVLEKFQDTPASVSQRLVWLGRRDDIDSVLSLCDFLVESVPMTGGVVRVDAMRAAVPVIYGDNIHWPLMTSVDNLPDGYPFKATDNASMLKHCRKLICDPSLRLHWSQIIQQHYQTLCSEERLLSGLMNLIADKPVLGFSTELTPPQFDLDYAVPVCYTAALNPRALLENVDTILGFAPWGSKKALISIGRTPRRAASRIWRALPLSNETRARVKHFLKH